MADHKNQHFVPRCVLKPFSLERKGLAINLFNLQRTTAIRHAPTKSQCARPYLYGADLELEKRLSELEGHYAQIIAKILSRTALSDADRTWLHLFAIVQWRRTARAIDEIRAFGTQLADAVFARHPEQRPVDNRTDHDVMMESIRMALRSVEYIGDLKLAVIRNQSNVRFVISDDPLVMTNRYHLQKLNTANFGLANSGCLLAMPVSPDALLLWYDRGVYTVPNASGSDDIPIKNANEANAFNEGQYLNAQHNIYFSVWDDRTAIEQHAVQTKDRRDSVKPKATVLVRDPKAPGQSYRHGTSEEQAQAREGLVMASRFSPKPTAWPTIVKLRSKPQVYSDGSAAGPMRRAEWLRRRGR